MITSYAILYQGGQEINPVATWVGGVMAFLILKTAIASGICLYWVVRKPPSWLGKAGIIITCLVVAWNIAQVATPALAANEITIDAEMLSQSGLQGVSLPSLVDGSTATPGFYTDSGCPAGSYLRITFTQPVALWEWRYYIDGNVNCYWDIQYSDDAVTWTPVVENWFVGTGAGWKTQSWALAGYHKYWQTVRDGVPGNGNFHMEMTVLGQYIQTQSLTESAWLLPGAIVYGFLLILSVFNKGWLFSMVLFFLSIGIAVYIETNLDIAGKSWIILGIGVLTLFSLLRTVANFGRFNPARM